MEESRRSFLKSSLAGGTAGLVLPLLGLFSGSRHRSAEGKKIIDTETHRRLSGIIRRYRGEFGE